MVRQLRGAGVRRDLARDLTRASSPLVVAPLGGVGLGRSDGTGPAEGCCLWWSSVWTEDVLAGAWRLSRPQFGPGCGSLGPSSCPYSPKCVEGRFSEIRPRGPRRCRMDNGICTHAPTYSTRRRTGGPPDYR